MNLRQCTSGIFWQLCLGAWQKAWSLLTQVATDLVWFGSWLSFHGDSVARYSLMEPIPLQVNMAIDFVLDLFYPSGCSLQTSRTTAMWCCVDKCSSHKWEMPRGWEHFIPSHTAPKDLPTAPAIGVEIGAEKTKLMTTPVASTQRLNSMNISLRQSQASSTWA